MPTPVTGVLRALLQETLVKLQVPISGFSLGTPQERVFVRIPSERAIVMNVRVLLLLRKAGRVALLLGDRIREKFDGALG